MKKVGFNRRLGKALRGSSGGFTFIEVLIALALFAIIGIVFAGGLSTASRATITADVRTNAESLARTQMEHVKNHEYIDYSEPDHDDYDVITPEGYGGYEIAPVGVEELQGGLQKITVTVSHQGREVITLVGYKLNRG